MTDFNEYTYTRTGWLVWGHADGNLTHPEFVLDVVGREAPVRPDAHHVQEVFVQTMINRYEPDEDLDWSKAVRVSFPHLRRSESKEEPDDAG